MDKEKYFELCRILNLQYDPENRFLPGKFFREFDFAIPHLGSQINKAVYYEVARYRRDVEESDKIYFMGWLDNDKQAHRVTEQNLQKTRRLLGFDIYEACKRKNISSRWTDDRKLAQEVVSPI